ncbi:hypothetical protein KVR01_013630 [Diaporthe batatas]|uniref:uncharacterized protein n=1 Tax=Diaporthe batatas TaxID=748121 RepID=UPI001D04E332|nr:uncharacterized protein KVR01_013630 [Diaporthe batatas]KAG8156526.1 hypothetical protein KVR01_013630 [Diaporthe batatas]
MTSPVDRPSHSASSSSPKPSRKPRSTRGILDAHIKKLSAGPLVNQVRAELLRRTVRRFDSSLPKSDTFTFQVAEADKMALLFKMGGSMHHIRRFILEYDVSRTDRRLDTAEQIEPYIIAIKHLPSLDEISFDGVSLGPWAAFTLAQALRTKTRLRRADFSNCFAQRGPHEISPALGVLALAMVELPNLGSINLSSNALGPCVEGPLLYLAGNHTPLQELNLNDTGLGPETGAAVARALASLAAKKKARAGAPPLRALLLAQNKLCQDDDDPMFGMREWAAALAAHPHLTTVALKNNGIRHGGMTHLVAEGLARLHGLEVLDLADNIIAARGATHAALAGAVGAWPALRSLLGSRGAALLIAALAAAPHPSRLEVLRLRLCNLSPANTLALAGVLWRLPGLRELALEGNNFSRADEGYQALVRLMRERGEARGVVTSVDRVPRRAFSDPSLSPGSEGRAGLGAGEGEGEGRAASLSSLSSGSEEEEGGSP